LDPQGRPSFHLLQNKPSRALPVYFYAFDLLNRNGELLVDLPIERRRELLGSMLAAPEDPLRLSPLLQASAGEVLEAVRKLGLKGVVGKRIGSTYEPGKRSGPGSSTARTESRISSLVVTFPVPTGLMHCSWAFTKTKSLSLSNLPGSQKDKSI
jgi:hypothetical protein